MPNQYRRIPRPLARPFMGAGDIPVAHRGPDRRLGSGRGIGRQQRQGARPHDCGLTSNAAVGPYGVSARRVAASRCAQAVSVLDAYELAYRLGRRLGFFVECELSHTLSHRNQLFFRPAMQTAPEAPAIGKDVCLSNRLEEEKARALAGQQYEMQQHLCVQTRKISQKKTL